MNERTMTLNEIREAGMAALIEALGPAGAIRFLQQFETGQGDYTAQRQEIVGGASVDELLQELKQGRQAKAPGRKNNRD